MRSSAVCSLSLALWVAAAPASAQQADQAPALTLVELMRRMATTSGVEARFRERKELALLAAPLVTHGALYFVPPGPDGALHHLARLLGADHRR
jgi:hypothetical protein